MIALGFGIIYLGYGMTFTGYCWVHGYNLSLREIWSPVSFFRGSFANVPLVSDGSIIIPNGSNTGGGSTAGQAEPTVGSSKAAKGVIGRSVTGTTTGSRL